MAQKIESEWPKQMELIFASDEQLVHPSVFAAKANEEPILIQGHRFNNFSMLVSIIAYVKRVFGKN